MQEIISTTLTVLPDPCNSICRGVDLRALGVHYLGHYLVSASLLLVPDSMNGEGEEKRKRGVDGSKAKQSKGEQDRWLELRLVVRLLQGKGHSLEGGCQWCCSKPTSPARHSGSATVGSSSPENLTQPHPRQPQPSPT